MSSIFSHLINDSNNIIVKTLSATDQSYYYISHLSQNHLNTSASSISNYSSCHLILASFLNHLLTHHSLTSLITYTSPNSKDFAHSSSFLTSPKSYLVNHTLLLKSVISLALLASPSPWFSDLSICLPHRLIIPYPLKCHDTSG